ncbi:MAG: glutamate racemase [Clostridia bacterium]|nr:glutamate racemase [Clostridia bacterium]
MIGIFDSGMGGLNVLAELRQIAPLCDVCFFADRENAPYGTKSPSELLRLVRRDVKLLRECGADEILIGCCTASTVYGELSEGERRRVFPIIKPTVKAALTATKIGRIGVIATEATVRSHAFRQEIEREGAVAVEYAAQALVSLVEGGESDSYITRTGLKCVRDALSEIKNEKIDALILGCTHFPRLSGIISDVMGSVRLISSAYEGALEISRVACTDGVGATVYL